MGRSICVYSSSSDMVAERYFEAARRLGELMASRGDTLIFGAGCIGLMARDASA